MMEVSHYRAFRELKNGGLVAMDLHCCITSAGQVLMPAKRLGFSDADALSFGGDPDLPVLVRGDTVFIDIRHAINSSDNPTIKMCLETVRKVVLLKFHH